MLKSCRYFVLLIALGVATEHESTTSGSDEPAVDETLSDELPELEESWISSLIEDMVLQRNNKVMKAPTLTTATSIKITNGGSNRINTLPTINGFQPVDLPERIVTTGSGHGSNNNYYNYHNNNNHVNNNNDNMPSASTNNGEVSETDMYLLGAIEKLAYRVDTMEKRLRRTEELLQHVIETTGNTQRHDPCPINFTRVERGCYYFSNRQYNWKSASSMCKSLGANLLELESPEEYSEVVTYLSSVPYLRDNEYWTGGLNPGLLWIWSNSARPVIPKRPNPARPEDAVHGNGRCLKLLYNAIGRAYQYYGADCSIRHKFVCEHEENIAVRALRNYQKSLKANSTVA